MGTKRKNSLTKNKKRYNDDFYLDFDTATLNKGIAILDDFRQVIRKDSDWSISFSVVCTTTQGSYVLMSNTTGATTLADGFIVFVNVLVGNVVSITFSSVVDNSAISVTSSTHIIASNQIAHFVINYNASTNEYNLSANGRTYLMIGNITNDYTRNVEGNLKIGSNSSFKSAPYEGGIKYITIADRQRTSSEIQYEYQTGTIPNSLAEAMVFHQSYNQIPTIDDTINYKKIVDVGDGWNAGSYFEARLLNLSNGYVEVTVLDNTAAFMIGFSDGITNANIGTFAGDYLLYCSGIANRYEVYESGSQITTSGTITIGDVLRVERIGTTMEYSYNGFVFHTSVAVSTAEFRPYLCVFRNGLNTGEIIDDVVFNGNIIRDTEINNLSTRMEARDSVANYNYAKPVINGWGQRFGVFQGTYGASAVNDFEVTVGDLTNDPSNLKDFQWGLYNDSDNLTLAKCQYGFYVGSNDGRYKISIGGDFDNVDLVDTWSQGDILRIERNNTTVNFYINAVLKHTETSVNDTYNWGYLIYSSEFTTPNFSDNKLNTVIFNDFLVKQNVWVKDNEYFAKPHTLEGNNGNMIGWSEDEIGVSNITKNSSFRDYYTKSRYYGIGATFFDLGNNNSNLRGNVPIFNTAVGTVPSFTNGITVVCKIFPIIKSGDVRGDIFYNNTVGEPGYLFVEANAVKIRDGESLARNIGQIVDRPTIIVIKHNNVTGTMQSFQDGLEFYNNTVTSWSYDITATNRLGSLFPGRSLKGLYYLGIYDGLLSDADIKEKTISEDWLSLNPVCFYGSENNGNEYIDLSGNLGNAPIQNPTYFQDNQTYVDYSGFRPLKYGLNFNGSQYLEVSNFNPTDENGYTVICGYNSSLATIPTNMLFSKFDSATDRIEAYVFDKDPRIALDSSVKFTEYGANIDNNDIQMYVSRFSDNVLLPYNTYGFNSNTQEVSINGAYSNFANSYGTGTKSFADITGNFRIGSRNDNTFFWDGNILFFAVFKGILNDAEIKEIYNNGLFRNPSIGLQDKYELVLYPDFNNPFDDGGTLKFPDLSPSNHTIIANGWLSLGDLQNSRIDLNTLR